MVVRRLELTARINMTSRSHHHHTIVEAETTPNNALQQQSRMNKEKKYTTGIITNQNPKQ